MCYLQKCLTINMLQALEYRQCKLNPKKFHDLYHGEITDEITYIQKSVITCFEWRIVG